MNPNHTTAIAYMEAITIAADDVEDRRLTMDAAQVEATLALAYEQRTANLIALMGDQSMKADVENTGHFPNGAGVEISAMVRERLGLA